MDKELINRVANSNLVTINLENYFPNEPILTFDIKDFLFHGLILKEKDFRAALKEWNWSQYNDAHLCIYCSTEAIIPTWAYMLVATYATQITKSIFQGNESEFLNHYYNQLLQTLCIDDYEGEKIVIKGCSAKPVPPGAYATLTALLKPVARSIMYGEPCSTVPIYKKPRASR